MQRLLPSILAKIIVGSGFNREQFTAKAASYRLIFILLCFSHIAGAAEVDISDTQRLLFVADRTDNLIDIVDPRREEVLFRLDTPSLPHAIAVTPFAPLLIYTNRDERRLYTFNLQTRTWLDPLDLPLIPRHVVLDTSGSKLGITDDINGGFALVSAYTQQLLFHLPAVPPTGDVLFDPNEIDIFYTNDNTGSLGIIDTNLQRHTEIPLSGVGNAELSSPSRSLDGRYIYVANLDSGEVYNMNAYSKVIYKTFSNGAAPARPYTTPEGLFLYVMDEESGRLTVYDQNRFAEYVDVNFGSGIDLVTVGRQDRMNLFMSSQHKQYHLYDNARRRISATGEFSGTPQAAWGSVDGKTAFVSFTDRPALAKVDLASGEISTIAATNNGAGAFALGLSNNVCH